MDKNASFLCQIQNGLGLVIARWKARVDVELVQLLREEYGAVMDPASWAYVASKGSESVVAQALGVDSDAGTDVSSVAGASSRHASPVDERPPAYYAIWGAFRVENPKNGT